MTGGGVMLVGGGTGGHVFPMIAVADALRELSPGLPLVFVGTHAGLEARVVPARGYQLELIEASPLRGGGLSGMLKGSVRVLGGIGRARALLKAHQPRVVFSLGGYVAGAVCLAAKASRIPLALMEPNSIAGLANRLIAPFVQRAYIAFTESERFFSRKVALRSGVALRRGFEPTPYSLQEGSLRLLVIGGSQGARALNEAVPRMAAQMGDRVQIVHQVGRGNIESVTAAYRESAPAASVSVLEFIDDVPKVLADCDLVISRAGASAVSEICAVGRPSILVPFPFAADDHQRHNAEALQSAGAARCVLESASGGQGSSLAERLAQCFAEVRAPERLRAMAEAARGWGRPHAAVQVARDLLELGGLLEPAPVSGVQRSAPRDGMLRRAGLQHAGVL